MLVPRDEVDEVRSTFARLAVGDVPNTHENDWLTKDGKRHHIVWSNVPLVDSEGFVSHIIGTGIDVTASRKAEEALVGIEAVRSILAGDGPTERTLQEIMAVLSERFGYTHASIYLLDGDLLRLGAQVGYAEPIVVFDGATGVIGQVLRTRRAVFLPDVSRSRVYLWPSIHRSGARSAHRWSSTARYSACSTSSQPVTTRVSMSTAWLSSRRSPTGWRARRRWAVSAESSRPGRSS